MTRDDARALMGEVLARIAPGTDLDAIDPAEPLTDEADLDSMDLLALLTALHERTGLEFPDSDAAQFRTLDSAIAYLVAHAA